MKYPIVMLLFVALNVFAAGAKRDVAQVIDEKSWNQVDKDKRIPILEEHFGINGCASSIAFKVSTNVFESAPGDIINDKNMEKMLKGMLADKEVFAALKSYCATKYFSK